MKVGPSELMIILAVVLIIFGPKQLPKLAKMFGKTAKSFKEGMDDEDGGDDETATKTEAKASSASEKKTEDKAE